MVALAGLALGGPALAQPYAAGARVSASPLMMEGAWRACVIVSGPGANDYYQVNCAADPARERQIFSVPGAWIKAGAPAPTPAAVPAAAGPQPKARTAAAPATALAPGTVVMASPQQMESVFKRCIVVQGPRENDYYDLDCADEHAGVDNRMIKTVKRFAIPRNWIRPNNPAYRPDMQVAAIRTAQTQAASAPAKAAPKAAPVADGGTLRVGEYACYGSGGQIMAGLGFKVLAGGRYTDLEGHNAGTFSVAGGVVSFHGGHMGGQQGRDLRGGNFRIGAQADCEPF